MNGSFLMMSLGAAVVALAACTVPVSSSKTATSDNSATTASTAASTTERAPADFDQDRFCVYADKLYEKGAVISAAGVARECSPGIAVFGPLSWYPASRTTEQ